MKRYPTKNVSNMRDLGGYPAKDGKMTLYGRFIRSDEPSHLSEDEVAMLKNLGLSTAIDLRSPPEAERSPSVFTTLPWVDSHNISFDPTDLWPTSDDEVLILYKGLVEGNPALPTVFRVIANAPGAVLYHCAAGKDRTGVVSAILLMLAGVADEDIIADYQVSDTYLARLIAEMRAMYPDMTAFMGKSKPIYMRNFLDWFHRSYESAQSCLLDAGLTKTEVEAIENKLLVK